MSKVIEEAETVDWRTDWGVFLRLVDRLYLQFRDNRVVTNRFANQRVCWTGTVEDKCDDPDLRGIDMRMDPVAIESPEQEGMDVSFLVLDLDDDEYTQWESVPIRSVVRFSTMIADGDGIFPGIYFAANTFQFSTKKSQLIEIISKPSSE